MSVHPYICECHLTSCTEKLHLRESEWRWLAMKGSVVSRPCARREGRRVLADLGEIVAVKGPKDRIGLDRVALAN